MSVLVAAEFAGEYDFSRVDRDDRTTVKTILVHLLTYHKPMPKVEVDIYPLENHYNMVIKGWTQEIDLDDFYTTFLNHEKRDAELDAIKSISWLPVGEGGSDGLINVKIHRLKFNKSSKRIK